MREAIGGRQSIPVRHGHADATLDFSRFVHPHARVKAGPATRNTCDPALGNLRWALLALPAVAAKATESLGG